MIARQKREKKEENRHLIIPLANIQELFLTLVSNLEDSQSFPDKYYVRDKETGKIFQQKLLLPEYSGKEFTISPTQTRMNLENSIYFELDLLELKEAYAQNRLSGKLKELVATLWDDDNNVYVIAQFK